MLSCYNTFSFMFVLAASSGSFDLCAPTVIDNTTVNFFVIVESLPVVVPYGEGVQLFSDVVAVSLLCRRCSVLYKPFVSARTVSSTLSSVCCLLQEGPQKWRLL